MNANDQRRVIRLPHPIRFRIRPRRRLRPCPLENRIWIGEPLGFSANVWEAFEGALRVQHLTQEADLAGTDAYGQTFTIRAILQGPTGAPAVVVSVWFVRTGEDFPRFVTAYPGGSQ